jgi:methylated-DNA-[protein]-cysteine S-methyltransferase
MYQQLSAVLLALVCIDPDFFVVMADPKTVGSALRTNPFAPYVPCHRVIASNFFIGGFFGEWGKDHKTGTRCNQKLNILESEGVSFDKKGHLIDADGFIWRG